MTDCTVSGNSASSQGGGLENRGSLTLTECTVSGNHVGNAGGGISSQGSATLIVVNTTISGNSAGGSAAGLAANGLATLTDSTISGNSAVQSAGGIEEYSCTMTLTNCTVSGNRANSGGGIYMRFGSLHLNDSTVSANTASGGGGISNTTASGRLTIENSIVSANTAATNPDIAGTINTDNGYNLFGTALSGATSGTGDVFNDTPLLAALGSYGGPTQTMGLLPGSPAIAAGATVAGVTTDQRGLFRGTTPDIGAFQVLAGRRVVVGHARPDPRGGDVDPPRRRQPRRPVRRVGDHLRPLGLHLADDDHADRPAARAEQHRAEYVDHRAGRGPDRQRRREQPGVRG